MYVWQERNSDAQYERTIGEVRLEPGESEVRNSKTTIDVRKEDIVVYGIKRCTEIKGNNDGGFIRIWGAENIVKSVENGCFSGVLATVSWLV